MIVTDSESHLRDRLVSLTRDMILIAGTAARPAEIARGFNFLENHLDGLGGVVSRRYEHEGHPSLVALPAGIETPEVIMIGHIDVIDHPDPEVYRSHLEGNRIIGPGAGDMKGQVAILLELFRAVHEARPGASLGLVITSDEESGGMAGARYLFEDAGLRCRSAVIPDGGAPDEVTIEEKGVLHLRIRTGGRTAHAARPWLGSNALELLMDRLARLRGWFDAQHGTGTPEDDSEHWFPTCSITNIHTPNETINRIPELAEATLDIRIPPPLSVEGMLATLHEVLGPEIAIETLLAAEPTHMAPERGYLQAIEEILGRPPRLVREDGGSDGRFPAALGIPVMISRPVAGNLHSVDEWIDIDSMLEFFRILEFYLEHRLGLA